jgi:hypothetical protein
VIELVEDSEESRAVNLKYGVIKGYNIFRLYPEDGQIFYIVAQSIAYEEKVVKYYAE